MKRILVYFVASFVIALSGSFAFNSQAAASGGNNSCRGRCGAALKVCERECKTQGQIQACRKKYERCCQTCS